MLGAKDSPALSPADALTAAIRGVRELSRKSASKEYEDLRANVRGGAAGGPRSARDIIPPVIEHRRAEPDHPYF
jgi:hypothetical protein